MYCGSCPIRRLASALVSAAMVTCVLLAGGAALAQAAVDLAYFEVEDGEDGVLVRWGTGNELTTYGFNLHRATVDDFGQSVQLNKDMIQAEQFATAVGADYSYLDTDVETGITYYYWLEVLDFHKDETHGPEWTTHGPTATPTSSPTRTPTPTATRISTPTPTATLAPTSTPTGIPGITPTLTATSQPEGSPTPTPRTTGAAAPSSPVSTPATALPTTDATAQPSSGSTPTGSQPTATKPFSPPEDGGLLDGSSQSRGTRFSWTSMCTGTFFLLVSVISFLAAGVVLAAYLVIRRLGT